MNQAIPAVILPIISKVCGSCRKELPLANFHKNRRNKGGFAWCCKPCDLIRNLEWVRTHPQKANKNRYKWAKKNSGSIKRSGKKFRRSVGQVSKKRITADYIRKYGKDMLVSWFSSSRHNNVSGPERVFRLKRDVLCTQTKFQITKGFIARTEWLNAILHRPLLKVGWNCEGCNAFHDHPGFFDADHIIPRSQGGGDNVENFQVICASCHRLKSFGIGIPKNHLFARLRLEKTGELARETATVASMASPSETPTDQDGADLVNQQQDNPQPFSGHSGATLSAPLPSGGSVATAPEPQPTSTIA